MVCCNGGVVAADDESGPLFVVCIFSFSLDVKEKA